LLPRHRIANGLAIDFEHALRADPAASRIDVDVDVDWREDRIEHLLVRRREYGEHRRERLRILSRHDLQQRLALRRARARVDDRLAATLALMDRTGPCEHHRDLRPVEAHIAVMALVDRDAADRIAITLGGQRAELAGTTVRAVAVDELAALDFPRCHG